MRIGIVGSRRRNTLKDRKIVFDIVMAAMKRWQNVTIVSGGATGPDSFAEEAADFFSLPKIIHRVPMVPPIRDKNDFRERAYLRNRLIVEESDVIFALVIPERTGGTENTLGHAKELGKKFFAVDEDGTLYL